MVPKTTLLSITLSLIALLSVASITNFEVFAEEQTEYNIAEDVKAILTFTFRDGVETHEFPVFSMTTDYISNEGTFFEVKGVVGTAPHLHKALDEAFKYRLMKSTGAASFEYNYRFFDVDVDFTRSGESFLGMNYRNCEISDYKVETLNSHDYESYLSSKSGFAIVDNIDFQCSGVNLDNDYVSVIENQLRTETIGVVHNYPLTSGKYAEDVRTFVNLHYDNGIERIEFPIFEITNE